jgi:hypothetical protein
MRAVFVGPFPAAIVPRDYWINRVRRGEVPTQLLIPGIAGLCVATDEGDDFAAIRRAERLICSWLAGGVLRTEINAVGKQAIGVSDVLAAKCNFESAGLWSEALQRWCGVWGIATAPDVTNEAYKGRSEIQAELGTVRGKDGNTRQWTGAWEDIRKWMINEGRGVGVGKNQMLLSVVIEAIAALGMTTNRAEPLSPNVVTVNMGRKVVAR